MLLPERYRVMQKRSGYYDQTAKARRSLVRQTAEYRSRPEITGDTAKGKSISVIRTFLPRKRKLADSPSGSDAEYRIKRNGYQSGKQGQLQGG